MMYLLMGLLCLVTFGVSVGVSVGIVMSMKPWEDVMARAAAVPSRE